MKTGKSVKKTQDSFGTVLYWTVGGLLILTMVSVWLVSGLFAKYTASDLNDDSARVANTGVEKFEVLEHEAVLDNGIYKLGEKKVKTNPYDKVIPGVDIPKDPFVALKLQNAEVDYELYIKVIVSDPFSAYVTYSIDTDNWICVDSMNGIYKYKGYFDAGTQYNEEIHILKDDKLYVSEHYEGKGQSFGLSFEAWLTQVDL